MTWAVEPQLRNPALVCAFEGWNDAASAATDAVRFLIRQLNATDVADLDAEDYFDFQAARPQVEILNGVVKRLRWPTTRIAIARVPRSERDLVLVLGVEPNLRWPSFCAELLNIASGLGCSTVVSLGALIAHVPHTRPVRVIGIAEPEVVTALDLQRTPYEGPTGIVGALTDSSRQRGLETLSLWAPVPRYVSTPPSPMATHALLDRFSRFTGIPLPLQSLAIAGRGWQQHVDQAIDDDDLKRWVGELESSYDEETDEIAMFGELVDDDLIEFDEWDDADEDEWDTDFVDFDDTDDLADDGSDADGEDDADDDDDEFDEDELPTGDAIARELERFLRDNDEDGPSTS